MVRVTEEVIFKTGEGRFCVDASEIDLGVFGWPEEIEVEGQGVTFHTRRVYEMECGVVYETAGRELSLTVFKD